VLCFIEVSKTTNIITLCFCHFFLCHVFFYSGCRASLGSWERGSDYVAFPDSAPGTRNEDTSAVFTGAAELIECETYDVGCRAKGRMIQSFFIHYDIVDRLEQKQKLHPSMEMKEDPLEQLIKNNPDPNLIENNTASTSNATSNSTSISADISNTAFSHRFSTFISSSNSTPAPSASTSVSASTPTPTPTPSSTSTSTLTSNSTRSSSTSNSNSNSTSNLATSKSVKRGRPPKSTSTERQVKPKKSAPSKPPSRTTSRTISKPIPTYIPTFEASLPKRSTPAPSIPIQPSVPIKTKTSVPTTSFVCDSDSEFDYEYDDELKSNTNTSIKIENQTQSQSHIHSHTMIKSEMDQETIPPLSPDISPSRCSTVPAVPAVPTVIRHLATKRLYSALEAYNLTKRLTSYFNNSHLKFISTYNKTKIEYHHNKN
jgi:hypothetical protein